MIPARQLPETPLRSPDLLQREIPLPRRGQVDGSLAALEAERLRPHTVLAFGKRWKNEYARRIGIDTGGNGGALGPGRHRDTFELLAGLRLDRAVQQLVVRVAGGRREQGRRAGEEDGIDLVHRVAPFC